MNEVDWKNCTNPMVMLEFLKGKASDRKLRLFACACCRLVWDSLTAERIRRAVEMAERYAEGLVADEDLERARCLACEAAHRFRQRLIRYRLVHRDEIIQETRMFFATEAAHVHRPFLIGRLSQLRRDSELQSRSLDLLRCIFGVLPFQRVAMDPVFLSWNDGILVRLAQSAYGDRVLPVGMLDPSRLAILADALEEAGCTDDQLLGHLRGFGPLVRGCYVIDAILGRE